MQHLDGLRGLAALAVYVHHYLLAFYPAHFDFRYQSSNSRSFLDIIYGKNILSAITNGNFLIYIFFVLSGLVLSQKYLLLQKIEILVEYAQKRFFRLFLPVCVVLIASYLMMKMRLFFNIEVSILTHSEWWLGQLWRIPNPFYKLTQCIFYSTLLKGDNSFDTSMWTLNIELYGSMFVFSILALTHGSKSRVLFLFAALTFCFVTEESFIASFLAGIFINYLKKGHSENKSWYSAKPMLAVWSTLAIILGSYPTNCEIQGTLFENLKSIESGLKIWAHPVAAFLVVTLIHLVPELQTLFKSRISVFLGKISFSLYLLHPLLIGSFSCFLFLKLLHGVSFAYCTTIVFLLSTLILIPIAVLFTRTIDNAAIEASNRLARKWMMKTQD